VGYTNAGKSTLLNALTRSEVVAEDRLFATLDPTSRRLRFPDQREVIVTDTVGFIEHLPADLLRAFTATLEELQDTTLLLHVVDASDPHRATHEAVVREVLERLDLSGIPSLLVLNKCDRLDEIALADAARDGGVPVSALRREGFDELLHRIEARLGWEGHPETRPAWRQRAEGWLVQNVP
jgi:GTP-binding protein HflX